MMIFPIEAPSSSNDFAQARFYNISFIYISMLKRYHFVDNPYGSS
jgi:hypothetical protein